MRLSKVSKCYNVSLRWIKKVLDSLGYSKYDMNPNSQIPEELVELLEALACNEDEQLLRFFDLKAKKMSSHRDVLLSPLRIIDKIDLSQFDKTNLNTYEKANDICQDKVPELSYNDECPDFYIEELYVNNADGGLSTIKILNESAFEQQQLFSVIIGENGVGKSSLLRDLSEFFTDVHNCSLSSSFVSASYDGKLVGIRYHIDGQECFVVKFKKVYLAKVNSIHYPIASLRFPTVVACHFGAFDKFHCQSVDGSSQTKYDVPYYKYFGAHVNGNMISSSSIAFRLLFVLSQHVDGQLLDNIKNVLDFVGYGHCISLVYSVVNKSRKSISALQIITDKVNADRDYRNVSAENKKLEVDRLNSFYRMLVNKNVLKLGYVVDFDNTTLSGKSIKDLHSIYKLKQCGLIKDIVVTFRKGNVNVTSEEMSSGEFVMLSTILSLAVSAKDPHTLILLDEPEISQHPNWQMSLIDNLDLALANRICHVLIATHSHMIVSDLPMDRSSVVHLEKDKEGNISSELIPSSTYGWSAEEVLLKVFKTATDRNRYFGELIARLLEKMGNNDICPQEFEAELVKLQEISKHLSDVDPMKSVLNTIVKAYFE